MTIAPLCQVCRIESGVKLVPITNGKRRIWKCAACLAKKNTSFMSVPNRRIYG